MGVRKKLFTLFQDCNNPSWKWFPNNAEMMKLIEYLIAHGVTVQECCNKAESVISKTDLMCTACYSDIDRDAVFCKYCGAKVMPQPPKGE